MSQHVESLEIMWLFEAIGADKLLYKEYKWEVEKWPKNSEFLMYVSSKEEPSGVSTAAQMGEFSMIGQARREGEGLLLLNTIENEMSILLGD